MPEIFKDLYNSTSEIKRAVGLDHEFLFLYIHLKTWQNHQTYDISQTAFMFPKLYLFLTLRKLD